jgi:hypothetical protein
MQTRKLSTKFTNSLKNGGELHPLLNQVWEDNTLDLEIREEYVNIYYRGGNLIKIEMKNSKFNFHFDRKYDKNNRISSLPEPTAKVNDWIKMIPLIKDIMDKYFTVHKKEEREFQQLIVRENNSSTIANGTDYFIIDIEYDDHDAENRARFDLVALKWESDGTIRKNQKGNPVLAFIEMKYGDSALAGVSGMADHLERFHEYVNKFGKSVIINEMAGIFEQKRELNLIPSIEHNINPIKAEKISTDFEYIFLLSNHDPDSKKLTTALNEIEKLVQSHENWVQPLFSTANFMGYGLYKENIFTLTDFKKRFEQQI